MGLASSFHRVAFTPNQWHVSRSSLAVNRSLSRPKPGGSSQTVSTSTSAAFLAGSHPSRRSAARACTSLELYRKRKVSSVAHGYHDRGLVHVGGILPGMMAGRLGCSILLVEVMSRRVTATPGRCAE